MNSAAVRVTDFSLGGIMRADSRQVAKPLKSNPPPGTPAPAPTVPPVTLQQRSAIELLPRELTLKIGSFLPLQQWLRLGQLSHSMYEAVLKEAATPFVGQSYHGRLLNRLSPYPQMILRLGSYYSALDLSGAANCLQHPSIVDELRRAPTWSCLKFDFADLIFVDRQDRLAQLLLQLIPMLKEKASEWASRLAASPTPRNDLPGWTCRLELSLPHAKPNTKLSTAMALVGTCEQISGLDLTSPINQQSLLLIGQIKTIGRLDIDLNYKTDRWNRLTQVLAKSNASIEHLSLRLPPAGSDFVALGQALLGKNLKTLALPAWTRNDPLDSPGLAKIEPGAGFAIWHKLNLQALSLRFRALQQDGEELLAMLKSTTTLQKLDLACLGFEVIMDSLVQGLRHNTTVKELNVQCESEDLPWRLLSAILDSKSLCLASLGPRDSRYTSRAAYFEVQRGSAGGFDIQRISMAMRDLHHFAPLWASVSTIKMIRLTDCNPAQHDEHEDVDTKRTRTLCQAFQRVNSLHLGPSESFAFRDLPFDPTSLVALHMDAKQLELKGIEDLLLGSVRLKTLTLSGSMSSASGQALLEGLRGNQGLRRVGLQFHFQDKEDQLLCVHLIAAVFANKSIDVAEIELDNQALVKACQRLLEQSDRHAVTIVKAQSGHDRSSELHESALSLINKLIAKPFGAPLEEQYDPEWDSVCSVM